MKALHSGEALTADDYLKCLRRRTNKCLKKNSKRLQGQTSEKVKWGVYSTYIMTMHIRVKQSPGKPAVNKRKLPIDLLLLILSLTHSLTHFISIFYTSIKTSPAFTPQRICAVRVTQ